MKWLRKRTREVVEPTIPVAQTDARRFDGPTRRDEGDPDRRRSERLRRRVRILAFNVVFLGGILTAMLGRGGYFDLVRHRGQRHEVQQLVAEQRARNDGLQRTIDLLEQDPAAKERIAREELGMANPGEIQFLLPRGDDETSPPVAPEDGAELPLAPAK
jgi:cell division protein FtsB